MKLVEFALRDTPPVQIVEMSDLAEIVVVAGPNGVGKTRALAALLNHFSNPVNSGNVRVKLAATTPGEQQQWDGRETLDTADQGQAAVLRGFLKRMQKRGQLRGSVLNFDSSRSFERIGQYAWSWECPDPLEEEIGWDSSYQPVRNRFNDVVHSMLRKVRSHKENISDRAIALMEAGETSMPLSFADPLEKFKHAFDRLLPGKSLLRLDLKTQDIQYQEGAATLPLTSLSSGEREVVTIVFDFLLRDPQDCIIAFDEPELHLHPELSYRLLRTLRDIGKRNQFIFCTHSPDIITASLDQTVVFIAPASDPPANQAITLREDDNNSTVLNLLGQSVGVISLGRRLVLIEGEKSSLDKQTYGAIVGTSHPDLILVPAGGKGTLAAFAQAVNGVLQRALWGIDWFMLADGDAATAVADKAASQDRSGGRLRLLPRYHLENYFLDEVVLAAVFEYVQDPPGSWRRDPRRIREILREVAEPFVSYGAALRVAHRLRIAAGNVDALPKSCHGLKKDALITAFETKLSEQRKRLDSEMSSAAVRDEVELEYNRLQEAWQTNAAEWSRELPGRPILHAFAAKAGIKVGALKPLYIKCAQDHDADPFYEIRTIFDEFARFGFESNGGEAQTVRAAAGSSPCR
jgi:energy-coupling factor transporter ATP-binding protein EcfA2